MQIHLKKKTYQRFERIYKSFFNNLFQISF